MCVEPVSLVIRVRLFPDLSIRQKSKKKKEQNLRRKEMFYLFSFTDISHKSASVIVCNVLSFLSRILHNSAGVSV